MSGPWRRRRSVPRLRSALAGTALCLLVAAPPGAQALPSSTPDESAFVPSSDVFAIARSGGLTYIGGAFTHLTRLTGGAAQLEMSEGQVVDPSPVVDGTVHAITPDGSGGYYLGGTFSAVGGVSRNNIAHVLADGTVDPAFDPDASATVRAIAVSGNEVFVGGDFNDGGAGNDSIGGEPRNHIAKLSAASGNAFSGWNPDATGIVNALAVSGTALYVGGQFDGMDSIAGEDRDHLAKLSTTSGNAFSLFAPNPDDNVLALAVSGTEVFVGGAFTDIAGQSRPSLAKLAALDGELDATFDTTTNGNVQALALSGFSLFVGGTFNEVNEDLIPGGTARQRITRVSTSTGNVFSFNPGTVDGAVSGLAVSGSQLFVSGLFTQVGGLTRHRLGKLSTTSGNAFSLWNPNVQGAGQAFAIAVSGSEVYVGGSFNDMNTVERNHIAALDADGRPTDFNPNADDTVESLEVSGDDVYVGGKFENIGGAQRSRVAKLYGPTGNAFSSWDAGDVDLPSFPLAEPSVKAIAVSGTDLFVGGNFEQIGGDDAKYLAKLSTTTGNAFTTWAGGDGGATNQVFALALSGTNLFAGGLGGIGDPERNHLNKLYAPTGNAFSSFNANVSGVSGEVHALAVSGTDLYVGGAFDGIGGDPTRERLAQLYTVTGNAFSSFNPGEISGGVLDGRVEALGVSGSNVYAGGYFEQIGGGSQDRLAALFADTGNAFSTFDPHPDDHVRALAVEGDDLYAGGAFLSVGDQPRAFYAQFTGP